MSKPQAHSVGLHSFRETVTVLERLVAAPAGGVMATLVATQGSSLHRPGDRLILSPSGEFSGAVTLGGCASPRLHAEMRAVQRSAEPEHITLNLGEADFEFGLTCDGRADLFIQPLTRELVGAHLEVWRRVCAGERVRLVLPLTGAPQVTDESTPRPAADAPHFTERYAPPPRLFVVGSSAVAAALVTLARPLGFFTTVADANPDLLTRERFPLADARLLGVPSEVLRAATLRATDAFVLASHNYADEVALLKEALKGNAAYLAVVASRRRGTALLEFLRALGVSSHALERVHVPAGLELGVSSPAGVALSVLSELCRVIGGVQGTSPEPFGASVRHV